MKYPIDKILKWTPSKSFLKNVTKKSASIFFNFVLTECQIIYLPIIINKMDIQTVFHIWWQLIKISSVSSRKDYGLNTIPLCSYCLLLHLVLQFSETEYVWIGHKTQKKKGKRKGEIERILKKEVERQHVPAGQHRISIVQDNQKCQNGTKEYKIPGTIHEISRYNPGKWTTLST